MEEIHFNSGNRRRWQLSWTLKDKSGVVVQACKKAFWRLRQEDPEFKASFGYTARPCLKKQNVLDTLPR
jgi:hypothetical protein